MAIQFITGGCGTGKTTFIYNKMIEASMSESGPDNMEKHDIFYILPEQSNLAAEQDMVNLHPNGGTMDISILSFSRLAFQLLDKENVYTRDILDDYGKSMMLMKVLGKVSDKLCFYKRMTGKKGFIDELKSIISEFYQYRITDEMLDTVMEDLSEDKSLFYKLKDLKLIRNAFESEMGDSYMVAEQLLSLCADNIADSDILKDADIYFDGFTGFTPIQYVVIEEMMKVCHNMYFSVNVDEGDSSDLFFMGKETIERITNIAQNNSIKILQRIRLKEDHRHKKNGELAFLESSIFRFPVKRFGENNLNELIKRNEAGKTPAENGISIIQADDTAEEILCAGRCIRQLVINEGYRYRDIAIVTGDLNDSSCTWKQIMERMDIPYFLDVNEPLIHNPVSEITVMLFELFENDFSYECVFNLLKTGLTGIDSNRIYELENYILKTGIRGKSLWQRPFKGKASEFELGRLNNTRLEFMKMINSVSDVFGNKNAKTEQYIRSLYSFLESCDIENYLNNIAESLQEKGDIRQAKVYEGAYKKYIMVLDKTMDILGDEMIDRELIKEVLVTGISGVSLGIIPSTLDQVMIGDIKRSRFHHKKVIFFTGVNEGILPQKSSMKGLITDRDRYYLEQHEILLAPDSKRDYLISQFYVYMQIAQAEERLIFSYRKMDGKGNALNIAVFLKWIRKMFTEVNVLKAKDVVKTILPMTIKDVTAAFARALSEDGIDDSSLYRILMKEDKDALQSIVKGYLYLNQPGGLNEKIAKKLYSKTINEDGGKYEMVHSVSRLETYSACAFKYFIQYGLDIKKREEYVVEANHIGTILHAVMEEFFKLAKDKKPDSDKLLETVDSITVKKAYETDSTIFESSYRMGHQLDVIKRIARRSVTNLCRHLEYGDLSPAYFEKHFSKKDGLEYISMALAGDVVMNLNGIIDRVDIKETNDAVYYKIIDYKSSNKQIDYVKIIEGKQLQLAVYLSVMQEMLQKAYPDKKIIPTGMFYYQLADKIADGDSETSAEANRIKINRLTGVFNSDESSIMHIDQKSSIVLPVVYKKDGTIKSSKYEASIEEISSISKYTRDKMIEIGKKIICGQIDMHPQKGELSSPCQYCDYKSICRFEPGLGGNEYGIGLKLSAEEARTIVCNNDEGKGDTNEVDKGSAENN